MFNGTHGRPPRAILAATVALVALTGCSSIQTGFNEATRTPLTAEQVVGKLTAKVATAQAGQVITAESDPNDLLGRPGQYTAAMTFSDSRVPADQRNPDSTSLENGGKVEVFASEDEARSRADYIGRLARATPLATEYDYPSGTSLVRVSRLLTPAQAEEYRAALAGA